VHEPEASGYWELEPEPVHHESDDYHVYGKSGKGGKGSKGESNWLATLALVTGDKVSEF